ncbi:MAG: DUF1844 domain-containing protein [Candidatus Omnitrophica bacterium]|nr:DUF1844 domain-containing protein [Candidatus Omnitrophota bacterium]
MTEEKKISEKELAQLHFIQYISILANSGMMQLGKIMNPITGKIEKNLEAAQATISLLSMLKEKTKGNLSADEDNVLAEAIANLQLNFADEVSRKIQEPEKTEKKDKPENESQAS